jgi:hypothetical protein
MPSACFLKFCERLGCVYRSALAYEVHVSQYAAGTHITAFADRFEDPERMFIVLRYALSKMQDGAQVEATVGISGVARLLECPVATILDEVGEGRTCARGSKVARSAESTSGRSRLPGDH